MVRNMPPRVRKRQPGEPGALRRVRKKRRGRYILRLAQWRLRKRLLQRAAAKAYARSHAESRAPHTETAGTAPRTKTTGTAGPALPHTN